jgi:hypothetical protein|tara:strand:+ start:1228 stop:1581 length:354 start_codon:yes stop_codon:yes gene_type:complete
MAGLAVTRGLGPGGTATNLIARGLLPVGSFVRLVRGSFRKAKETKRNFNEFLEELKVSVALIAFNGKDLVSPIINTMRTSYRDEPAPRIEATPARLTVKQPDIKINVTNIRSKHVDN